MQQMEILKKYLRRKEDVDVVGHPFPFVTISRESGAHGHEVGREIIRHLEDAGDWGWNQQWDLFDQKLCAAVAQSMGAPDLLDALLREDYNESIGQSVYEMIIGDAEQYKLQKKIQDVVRMLATVGKVVILGRAGAWVTRQMPLGVRLRLVANKEDRISNIMQQAHTDRRGAIKIMDNEDKNRARLVRHFFQQDIHDPLQYDLVCNLSRLATQDVAEAVVGLLHYRMRQFKARP